MRSFMYACIAIAALSFAIHCWVQPANAQAPGNPVVGAFGSTPAVVTANGDVYLSNNGLPGYAGPWVLTGNVFTGAPVQAQHTTFGAIHRKYAR